jgi:hypothetical protein
MEDKELNEMKNDLARALGVPLKYVQETSDVLCRVLRNLRKIDAHK